MADRWPALMLRETAAEYCDMSPVQFDRQCPVAPVDQGWRGLRWRQADLDAWDWKAILESVTGDSD